MIDRIVIQATCAGADGSAAATAYSPHVSGKVQAVHIDYTDAPNTTDITLSDESDPAAENIVALTDANTDVKLYPRRAIATNANAAITYDGTRAVHTVYTVHGRLKLTVAQANAGSLITATVWLET